MAERSRILGLAEHYERLAQAGLSERDLFCAQGNAFDHWAVQKRMAGALLAWLGGAPLPDGAFPRPSTVAGHYQQLRQGVLTGAAHSFPMATQVLPDAIVSDDPSMVWPFLAQDLPAPPAFASTNSAAATGRRAP